VTSDQPAIHDAREALKKYFGFRAFLDGQKEVIAAILSGQDTMVVMPTGKEARSSASSNTLINLTL
jgi:ATP-dependent DNA helicase RecQ